VPGLTNGDTYTFTVTALRTGGNSAPSAPSPPVVVGAPTNPPQPPTIESLGTGDGFVDVTFVLGAAGGSPTTGYLVTASDATDASRGGQTAQGTSSPIRVTGLTNADAYSFTVTALSAGGNSAPSVSSSLINVGVPSVISGTPPNGTVRVAYSFPFVVSGVPTPTLTVGGTLPPGLTLDASGLLSGMPTTPGSYAFSILAANGVGQSSVSPTVVIGTGVGDEPTPTVPPPSPTPTASPTTSPSASPTTTPTPSPSSTDPGSPGGGSGSGYADSDGLSSSASAYLAGTGTSVLWPVAIAALLVVLGGAALWLSRRRRAGDAR